MKKEVLPEQLNYNKFPGPTFLHFGDQVKSEDGSIIFRLVHNEKEAFNAENFGQRFSELLLKYDFLLGDWSSEQLRLKGFYHDDHQVRKASRWSRIDDYLKEYCAFGCAYFILENPNPVELVFEEENIPKRRRNRKRPSTKKLDNNRQEQNRNANKDKKLSSKSKIDNTKRTVDDVSFSRQKRRSKQSSLKRKLDVRTAEASSSKSHFTIRKKNADN
ncbi:YutD family protein [Streptococcus hyovaginalis]